MLFYLATYGFATVGAFAVVTMVRDSGGEATAAARWAGLGKGAPMVAGVFAFFLLAMAGIPLTSGFIGKWAVFEVALSAGAWPVVVVALVTSIVAAFFYVRVIVSCTSPSPIGAGPTVAHPLLTAAASPVRGGDAGARCPSRVPCSSWRRMREFSSGDRHAPWRCRP